MNRDISELILYEASRIAEDRVKTAPYDKTYSGIISNVLFEPTTDIKDEKFGQYKIRYGTGTEKIIKLNDGLVHEVGERVKVHVPENDRNRMYIEPLVKRVIPYKIVYDDEKTSFIEHMKIETNGKVYEIESEYKLVVKNKGTENEEVEKMIFPDGTEVVFEGWDIWYMRWWENTLLFSAVHDLTKYGIKTCYILL